MQEIYINIFRYVFIFYVTVCYEKNLNCEAARIYSKASITHLYVKHRAANPNRPLKWTMSQNTNLFLYHRSPYIFYIHFSGP